MIALARIVVQLLADLAGLVVRRVDAATRVSLAVLSRLCDWRDALVVVRPETLIQRMASENPLWGEERIANELRLKLGLRVSPRTVRKYMPKRPPGRPRGEQRWATFLHNHAGAIVACDFLTVLKSPPYSPQANAICERVIGTIRRECLDWLIPLSESHLRSILRSWVGHYNHGRPHMALGPGVPDPPSEVVPSAIPLTRHRIGERLGVRARSVPGSLHHEYLLAPALA